MDVVRHLLEYQGKLVLVIFDKLGLSTEARNLPLLKGKADILHFTRLQTHKQ